MKKLDLKEAVSAKVEDTEPKKAEIKSTRATKPIEKRTTPPLQDTNNPDEKFTGLFDLTQEGVYVIKPGRKKNNSTGGTYAMQSIYFHPDEMAHLKELAEKYGLSVSAVVRTLVANSK